MHPTTVTRLLTRLRDESTGTSAFRQASDQLARLLAAEVAGILPHEDIEIRTPVGPATGLRLAGSVMLVPIYRAGQSLVQAFLDLLPDAAVGSILIQRDEATALPSLFYQKLPTERTGHAIILDPMLATAGSAVKAVEVLREAGYPTERILFAGVVAARTGYQRLAGILPEANIVVATTDPELNEHKYIVPGLGDYGDRYFGT